MLLIYNSQQYKELDIKGFLVKSLLHIWNICPPISRLIKYKEIKHKAFQLSRDAMILRLKKKNPQNQNYWVCSPEQILE